MLITTHFFLSSHPPHPPPAPYLKPLLCMYIINADRYKCICVYRWCRLWYIFPLNPCYVIGIEKHIWDINLQHSVAIVLCSYMIHISRKLLRVSCMDFLLPAAYCVGVLLPEILHNATQSFLVSVFTEMTRMKEKKDWNKEMWLFLCFTIKNIVLVKVRPFKWE